MKQQEQNKQIGQVFNFFAQNKQQTQLCSIYISWVNEAKLHRVQLNDKKKTANQYLNQEYPIQDPDSSQKHQKNQCKTIFQAFESAGCHISFLSKQDTQKKEKEKDHQKIMQLEQMEKKNKQKFLDVFGLEELIYDCYTVHHEDMGAEVFQIIIFRDQKYWYRFDTDKRWPGYEY